jgi:hypothetical protein
MSKKIKMHVFNGVLVIFGCLVLFLTNCSKSDEIPKYRSQVYQTNLKIGQEIKEKQYLKLKRRITQKQQRFTSEFKKVDKQATLLALSKKYTYKLLTDTIFPYWYDTGWDYNGISQTPGKGKIACGYFVTTCLRDAGFKVERSRLAQQASSNIMKSVCGEQNIYIIGHNNMEELKSYLLNQKNGLFIIGLDNHVGFVNKEDQNLWIIHSNGVAGSLMVERENLMDSKLVNKSQAFYLAPLTNNSHAHNFWIKSQQIPTLN